MRLTTEIFGDVVVVHAPDELGEELAGQFTDFLTSQERDKVILDLDDAELIDSKGLESLLDIQDQLRERGGDLRISTGNPMNRKIMEITRLDAQLEVFDTVIDAVNSLS